MINRQAATQALCSIITDQLVVTGLGNVALDLFVARDRALNFYTSGAMGTATSIAFGLAMARPDDRVLCLEGEGSLLMNLGALATIGRYRPGNLTCVIWDNQLYQITGKQATHTGAGTDLAAVARACSIQSAALVEALDDLSAALERTLQAPGPHLVVAKVDEELARGFLPRKGLLYKYRFMGRLGTLPETAALVWD